MNDLITALDPLISRVRTDVTAIKRSRGMSWTKEPLTQERLLAHLNGGVARGVCPIKEGENTTRVALLDLDSHKGETDWDSMIQVTKRVNTELANRGMNPVNWRSSGGNGIHIFILWNSPQDAYSVRETLKSILENLGYKNGTGGVSKKEIEIFPKQDSVPVGGFGNQFILPLTGKSLPLNPNDLSPMDRECAKQVSWPMSSTVPACERPAHKVREKTNTPDLENLEMLLQHISPLNNYDIWIKVGMALHYETDGSEQGLNLWDSWSDQEGADYPGEEVLKYKWNSFNSPKVRPATIGTLIFLAKQGGLEEDSLILTATDHSDIARKIVDAKFRGSNGDINLLRTQGQWFKHNEKCYQESSEESIRATVRHYLDSANKIDAKGNIKPFHPSMAQISAVTDALKSTALIEAINQPSWINDTEKRKAENYISMDNGLFYTPKRELQAHTPNFFTLNTLPYAYEEKGDPVEFLKFLNSIWENDQESKDTLQELFGYLLVADVSLDKIFLIKGPKRSGKGTISHVLKALLGASNICGPTLNSMAGNFGLQELIGKLVAIVPDARIGSRSDKQAIVENLLMVSGGDNISVPRKNIEAWYGQLPTRIVILTNETPQLGDASGALASRFIVLEMKKSFFGIEDHDLKKRLMAELPQIFNWALDGLDRLKERGRFIQPQSASNIVHELESLNSPLVDFVNTHCELGSEYTIPKDFLYHTIYKRWCEEQGISFPKRLATFSRDLQSAFPMIGTSRPGSGSNRTHVFTGIKVKEVEVMPKDISPPILSQLSQGIFPLHH